LQRSETSIPGVYLVQPNVSRDARGFFLESYHRMKFTEIGIADEFVQDNHSRSAKGVLRGLHYQLRRPQAKLCRVIEGEALDVAVDIRLGSPYFGKWVSVVLSAEAHNQIYVPRGFAHGFVALTETVQFLYKCSDFYDPSDERGIAWNDPDLAIDWRVPNPTLSERDQRHLPLAKTPREFLPVFEPTQK
jgi:dTDP-4-dehydrorhamnose 3,5-epimerase